MDYFIIKGGIMFKKLLGIIIAVIVLFFNLSGLTVFASTQDVGVTYQSHVQNIGWQNWVSDGAISGTTGQSLRLEASKIGLTNSVPGMRIKYKAHVQNIGWQDWVYDSSITGTVGQALRLEAIQIELENAPGYSVEYQAHVQNIGWQNWVSDGATAGTTGKGLRVEALRIRIVKNASETPTVNVSSVSLNKTTDTLVLGNTDILTATVNPSNATNQGVTWTSSDNNVATVDNTGKVTSINAGTATITAISAADASKTASCNVTVNRASIKGIDVSHWQGSINWQSVKSSGIQFAMIASSYRDNGVDSMFETNYTEAKANGIMVGAYHYSYAKTVAEATNEANFFISRLKGKQFDYPVCVDLEDPSQSTLDNATLTNIALTYLSMLKQAGYYPMIYANKEWFTTKLDSNNVLTYDHWLAQWNNSITYSGPVQMWQYSSTGTVSGIDGPVDMDTSFVDYASLIKSLHLNGY